jgi:hypothetical protein
MPSGSAQPRLVNAQTASGQIPVHVYRRGDHKYLIESQRLSERLDGTQEL